MRIIDKNSVKEIVDLVVQKARYQKVVICLDENSDVNYIENMCNEFDKNAVVIKYYYNRRNLEDFFNIVNNGARVVIYNVSIDKFYKLKMDNNYILNIFIPQTEFILPYVSVGESVFGDNLLVCNQATIDYKTVMCLYEMAINYTWRCLVYGDNIDLSIFKRIDGMASGKDFYITLLELIKVLREGTVEDCQYCDEQEIPCYTFVKLYAIIKMLEDVNLGKEQYIDFYKTEKSAEQIDKAYALVVKHNVVELLRGYSGKLILLTMAVLKRFKIIIKKYFNFKNFKINKLNKIIKNNAKMLNTDSLLYISYILNAI